MSEQLAAFPESPQHTQTVSLGGVQFRVTFTFRDRTSSWYMDLRTIGEEDLALGRRLSPRWGPVLNLALVGGPKGILWVEGPEPYARFDLGGLLVVKLVDPSELPVATTEGLPRVTA